MKTINPKYRQFTIIAATGSNNEIGIKGDMPWNRDFPEDLKHFRDTTFGGVIIMGRKTWDSLGGKALPNRTNIVISLSMSLCAGSHIANSLGHALDIATTVAPKKKIFVIGGAQIYAEAIKNVFCSKLIITRILNKTFPEADRYFPDLRSNKHYILKQIIVPPPQKISPFEWHIEEWTLANREEHKLQYKLYSLLSAPITQNRTGVSAYTKFGITMKYDLSNGTIPLLTTRRMFPKGIFLELMWILRGDTSAKRLADDGCSVWLQNSTREFLDNLGLTHFKEGDLGETYGFLMRYFGAEYKGCDKKPKGGIDQLALLIDGLRTDPLGRRHIINLWNPESLDNCALPPCLFCYTFMFTDSSNCRVLNLHINQRSSDFFLARSWNDTFAAMFLHLICSMLDNVKPGKLLVSITNAHVYTNHTEQVLEQLTRKPVAFPQFKVPKIINTIDELTNLVWGRDVFIENYNPCTSIKANMAV